ncbi:MAG: D-alanyl-D-alanine carboxypeptidase, partial [Acidimicrobiia bacterium]|nr:D-alanyl-D-alanine carboxypeptidase [Acidimicrobiia bacterium]
MGGGRLSWAGRILAVIAAAEIAASSAVLALHPTPARSAALVRSVPTTTTSTSVVPDPTTLPPAPSTSPPTTARPAAPPPTLPADPVARLTARLEAALGSVPSCLVVQDSGATAYARAPQLALAPASTQKLLVAVAALQRLGPDYRFETTVVAPARPTADGSVDALWLVGSGDPMLGTGDYAGYLASQPRSIGTPVTPMTWLVDQLAAAGVHSVRNGVHGDDSRYDGPRWLPGWKPIYRDEADISPLSALTVNGGLDKWQPSEVVTADPTALASTQLTQLLVGHGISAAPAPNAVHPASGVVLARVSSVPLSDIVSSMLRTSDNLAAELIVKEIDKKAGGTGTTAGGLALVASTLQTLGIPTGGVHMGDGSGLDPGDRATCPALLAAMNMGDTPAFASLVNGLAVAGRSGTLVKRFVGSPIAGHLQAKTGWIDCAAAMVGQMNLRRPLHFALIVNGPCNYDNALSYEDRVANALAAYP